MYISKKHICSCFENAYPVQPFFHQNVYRYSPRALSQLLKGLVQKLRPLLPDRPAPHGQVPGRVERGRLQVQLAQGLARQRIFAHRSKTCDVFTLREMHSNSPVAFSAR